MFFFIFLKCIQVTLWQKFFKPFTRKYFRLFSKHEKPQYPASGPKERVRTLMAAIIMKAMAWLLRFLLEKVVNTLPDPAVITQFTARYTRQVGLAAELYGKQCQKLFSWVKKVRVSSPGTRLRKSRFYTREGKLIYTHTHAQSYKKLVTTPLVVTAPSSPRILSTALL